MKIIYRFLWLVVIFCAGCNQYSAAPTSIKQAYQHKKISAVKPTIPLAEHSQNPLSPQRVVLLLPLTGPLATAGLAVKQGFLAAQKQAAGTMSIDIIDTNQVKPISVAYNQAIAKGADTIIGPLEKSDVSQLIAQHNFPVFTLALNYGPVSQNTDENLFQFGLSPLDEARQAAERAAKDGYHSAFTIVPAGEWGEGVSRAFKRRWLESGGSITKQWQFRLQDELSTQLKDVLGQMGSIHRARPNYDFDMIFLAAPPAIARQIKPLLKFYYAGNIPVYATSFIYSGSPQALDDRDLDGIIFCDIPWVLEPGQPLAQQLAQEDPKNYALNSRLYALGIDAYHLILQVKDLQASPGTYIKGMTGDLYIGQRGQILRRLPWAIFRHGLAERLGS